MVFLVCQSKEERNRGMKRGISNDGKKLVGNTRGRGGCQKNKDALLFVKEVWLGWKKSARSRDVVPVLSSVCCWGTTP